MSPRLAKPFPRGQIVLNSSDPGLGHSSQSTPQAAPTVQQHMSTRYLPGNGSPHSSSCHFKKHCSLRRSARANSELKLRAGGGGGGVESW